jgi:hypothetical protein
MDRHPLVSLLMLVGGILMLFPGACVIFVVDTYGWPTSGLGPFSVEFFLYVFWPFCFATTALGIYLLVKVVRDV